MPGCSHSNQPGKQRDSLDEETTDWRAVCGKTACTVRRAGSARADSDPYHDECRIRKDNAPANFATIKHMAGNLMRRGEGKKSMRVKQRLAAWDDSYLAALIAAG